MVMRDLAQDTQDPGKILSDHSKILSDSGKIIPNLSDLICIAPFSIRFPFFALLSQCDTPFASTFTFLHDHVETVCSGSISFR